MSYLKLCWDFSHFTDAALNHVDICDQLSSNPDTFHRLADMLEAEGLIARDTSQAVKANTTSAPYAKATQMLQPAIKCANDNQEKRRVLVKVLTEFNVTL